MKRIDKIVMCTYNVHMNVINTNLTTSGNSVAVRLPKELLKMSGLGNKVTLQAKKGQIIISKPVNTREGWEDEITILVAANGDAAKGFDDMAPSANDGLVDLPWDGPTFEEWKKSNG